VHLRHALDAGRRQIVGFDPDERCALSEHSAARSPAERGSDREQTMEHHAEQKANEKQASRQSVDPKRHVAGVAA